MGLTGHGRVTITRQTQIFKSIGYQYDWNVPSPFWDFLGRMAAKAVFDDKVELKELNFVAIRRREFIAYTTSTWKAAAETQKAAGKTGMEGMPPLNVVEVNFKKPQPGKPIKVTWTPARALFTSKIRQCTSKSISRAGSTLTQRSHRERRARWPTGSLHPQGADNGPWRPGNIRDQMMEVTLICGAFILIRHPWPARQRLCAGASWTRSGLKESPRRGCRGSEPTSNTATFRSDLPTSHLFLVVSPVSHLSKPREHQNSRHAFKLLITTMALPEQPPSPLPPQYTAPPEHPRPQPEPQPAKPNKQPKNSKPSSPSSSASLSSAPPPSPSSSAR